MQADYVHRKKCIPKLLVASRHTIYALRHVNPISGMLSCWSLWKHYCEESNCLGGNRLAELHLYNCKSLFGG